MPLRLNLTPKVSLVFVLFGGLLLGTSGLVGYQSGREALHARTVAGLLSTSLEKEAALNDWIDDRQLEIGTLAASPAFGDALAGFRAAAPRSAAARAAHDRVVSELQARIGAGGFLELFVIEPGAGQVIASTEEGEEGKFKEDRPYFRHGLQGPFVQSPSYSLKLQAPGMIISLPVRSPEGRVVGVLAGRLNPEELNTIIGRRTGRQRTDEVYLANKSRLFVTQPRFIADPAVLRRGVHSEDVKRCLAGGSGFLEGDDYRGVPVVSVYRRQRDGEMCLVVKMDQAEILEPVSAFGKRLALLGGLVFAITSVLAVGLARAIARPVRVLQAGVTRIAGGELAVRLPETRRDELGRLAQAFNAMAASLAEQQAQVRQRAAELEQANKELEAFSYSVSHDLRAPLRAMDGFSRILVEEYGSQIVPEARRYLQIVRDNTKQMGRLVDDLLAFSRLGRQAPHVQPLAPADVAREALKDLRAEQEGRRVEIILGELPVCQADSALLKQVYINLLSNALKFTRKRDPAVIEIGSTTISNFKLQIADLPAGSSQSEICNVQSAIYFVRDNGVGFDMKYAHKLFGVFQRLHRAEEYEGTGVGLAIVQRIIRRHGGRVWAEGEVDKGATFYFAISN